MRLRGALSDRSDHEVLVTVQQFAHRVELSRVHGGLDQGVYDDGAQVWERESGTCPPVLGPTWRIVEANRVNDGVGARNRRTVLLDDASMTPAAGSSRPTSQSPLSPSGQKSNAPQRPGPRTSTARRTG